MSTPSSSTLLNTFSFAQPCAPKIPEHLKSSTDIWDIVFDFVRDDSPTLKSCALVKSNWVTSIYKHLHRKLVISHRLRNTVQPGDDSSVAFMKALASSRVLPFVRELGLEFKRRSSDYAKTPWWSPHLRGLHFQPLRAIHLIRADWDYGATSFGVDLTKFFQNHPIQSLTLSRCLITSTFSIRLLCPHNIDAIRELILDQIVHLELESPLTIPPSPVGMQPYDDPFSYLDLSHLTTLCLTTSSFVNTQGSIELLEHCKETVQHLEMAVKTDMLLAEISLWDYLSRFSILETLHLVSDGSLPNLTEFNPPPTLREVYAELLLPSAAHVVDFAREETIQMNGWMNDRPVYSGIDVVFALAVPFSGYLKLASHFLIPHKVKLVMPPLPVGESKIVRLLPDVQVRRETERKRGRSRYAH
ncbi:hypothetical protein ONZ45_g5953 [Pleurotus djamor]|nr:hypothetical protein ONZ45_g5953 [Pleurotus djamor]